MLEKMKYVANDYVTVCYSYISCSIYIIDKKNSRTKAAGGWEGIYKQFNSFYDKVDEETTFNDAVNFFNPNTSVAKG